jgi:hypothetical protein
MSINQSNIGLAFFQFSDCLDRVIRNTDDTDVLPSARQLNRQQVSAHEVSVGDDDTHSAIGKL